MKTYCDPNVQNDFIASAKLENLPYEMKTRHNYYNNKEEYMCLKYPTKLIDDSFPDLDLEFDINIGSYSGTILKVYNYKDYYVFFEYGYGSCDYCDYYDKEASKISKLEKKNNMEKIEKVCEDYVNNIFSRIKLVDKTRIEEYIIDNLSHHWKYDKKSKMLELPKHFGIKIT